MPPAEPTPGAKLSDPESGDAGVQPAPPPWPGTSQPAAAPFEPLPAAGVRTGPECPAASDGGDEWDPGFATATPAVRTISAPTEVPAAIARLRFIRRERGRPPWGAPG